LNILQLRLPTGLLFYISTFFFFLIWIFLLKSTILSQT
jgi:hypothetical protein